MSDGGAVKIKTRETDDFYIVSVTDNGAGFDKSKKTPDDKCRFGITNIKKQA